MPTFLPMTNQVNTALLPITGRRALTASDTSLLDLFHTKASWIWTREDVKLGDSPNYEQRAFRKVFTMRGPPSNATITIAADDDFAMYVDGILVHAMDGTHDWTTAVAYHVPLPVVKQEEKASMTLGIRAMNKQGWAGLLVAVQINYPDAPTPDIFYTGGDQSWVGERLFEEHWEQPWFDMTSSSQSIWAPAVVYPSSTRSPAEPKMVRQEVVEYGQLPAASDAGSSCKDCSSSLNSGGRMGASESSGGGVAMSVGGFTGMMIGSVMAALLLGVLGTWLVMRKTKALRKPDEMVYEKVYQGFSQPSYQGISAIYEPQTKPGRQLGVPANTFQASPFENSSIVTQSRSDR